MSDINARKGWQEVIRTEAMGFQFSEIDGMVEFLTKIKAQSTVQVFVSFGGIQQFRYDLDTRLGLVVKDVVSKIVRSFKGPPSIEKIILFQFIAENVLIETGTKILGSDSTHVLQTNEQLEIQMVRVWSRHK